MTTAMSNIRDQVMKNLYFTNLTDIEGLRDVNRLIVHHLNDLGKARQKMAMVDLKVGDHVSFVTKRGTTVTGVITKMNQKSVNVQQDNSYTNWRVAPSLLKIL